jgi:hypothetical protein
VLVLRPSKLAKANVVLANGDKLAANKRIMEDKNKRSTGKT